MEMGDSGGLDCTHFARVIFEEGVARQNKIILNNLFLTERQRKLCGTNEMGGTCVLRNDIWSLDSKKVLFHFGV